jgi:hypothetical protein
MPFVLKAGITEHEQDEIIIGLFYKAIWNDRIDEAIKLIPGMHVKEPSTGPIGFYDHHQNFTMDYEGNDSGLQRKVKVEDHYAFAQLAKDADKEMNKLAQHAPLLKSNPALKNDIDALFLIIVDLAKNSIDAVAELLINLRLQMALYIRKNMLEGFEKMVDYEINNIYMPSLIQVVLNNIGTNKLNLLQAINTHNILSDERKTVLIQRQSPEVQEAFRLAAVEVGASRLTL